LPNASTNAKSISFAGFAYTQILGVSQIFWQYFWIKGGYKIDFIWHSNYMRLKAETIVHLMICVGTISGHWPAFSSHLEWLNASRNAKSISFAGFAYTQILGVPQMFLTMLLNQYQVAFKRLLLTDQSRAD
jgi:hypothetical protein